MARGCIRRACVPHAWHEVAFAEPVCRTHGTRLHSQEPHVLTHTCTSRRTKGCGAAWLPAARPGARQNATHACALLPIKISSLLPALAKGRELSLSRKSSRAFLAPAEAQELSSRAKARELFPLLQNPENFSLARKSMRVARRQSTQPSLTVKPNADSSQTRTQTPPLPHCRIYHGLNRTCHAAVPTLVLTPLRPQHSVSSAGAVPCSIHTQRPHTDANTIVSIANWPAPGIAGRPAPGIGGRPASDIANWPASGVAGRPASE
eukprot:365735-Chlamydomonas_euryale.AAC.2